MDEIIGQIQRVEKALGALNITSSYQNMNTLLACMQLLEGAVQQLRELAETKAGE